MSAHAPAPTWPTIDLRGTPVFRANAYPDPFWAIPNPCPGRFNLANSGPTQYLSLYPLDPYAHLIRVAERQVIRVLTATDPEIQDAHYNHWTLLLTATSVLDLSFDVAPELGLGSEDLVSDDHGACQEFAAQRVFRGLPDIWRYPSAALPGTDNIVIFGARGLVRYLSTPVSESDIPGSLSATGARPAVELLACMRHVGDPHPGLVAHRAGSTYTFPQPLHFATA